MLQEMRKLTIDNISRITLFLKHYNFPVVVIYNSMLKCMCVIFI